MASAAQPMAPREVLGVDKDADQAAIRSRFLQEARKWHPDKRPLDESEDDREDARIRFIAIHAAYETLSREAADSVEEGTTIDHRFGFETVFEGSAQKLEEARARRAEAEDYVKELRENVIKMDDWTVEEEKVLRTAWRRAYRAVEALKKEEVAAELTLHMSQTLREHRKQREAASAAPPNLDGPRGFGDYAESLSTSVREILGDLAYNVADLASIFAVFQSSRDSRQSSKQGETTPTSSGTRS